MPEGTVVSRKGMDLVAEIVGANVKNLAAVTDRLDDARVRTIKSLAETIVQVEMILDQATVIDRATENRLAWMRAQFDEAHRTLERMEESA